MSEALETQKSREVNFFVFTAMIFAVCEVLSIQLNHFFKTVAILGVSLELNVGVFFFCLSFFLIDIVTEIYDNKIANCFIYAKITSQALFILLGNGAVYFANIHSGQLTQTFSLAPYVLINGIIASFFGYKLTGHIMQFLKIKFHGQFLYARYLSSTLPGEVMFSLIFSLLNFSQGRDLLGWLNVFSALILIKFLVSFLFSFLVMPITNLLRIYLNRPTYQDDYPIPFT